uniref:Protein ARV n=1 Tax=Salmo trutta TaxID=8032 RepID=A0A674EGX9_SALTR
ASFELRSGLRSRAGKTRSIMANGFFRCFECNKDAHELRKDYSNGILKITICKLCVVCLLCESYLRWSQIQGSEQNNDPADIIRYTNEWECLEWQLLVYCSWKNLMLKAILLSSYGNILLIPIVIWEHDYSPLCFSFIMLFPHIYLLFTSVMFY